jgi:uncharacterized protein DUF4382
MKKIFIFVFSFLMIIACGGGGGGDSTGSGEVSMSITDAKPLLPEGAENVTNLWITFTDVLVHKPGGGWISLPLTGGLPSKTIDLIQFYDGKTTELVPPVLLESGKYTQIRLVIDSAKIKFDNNDEYDVEIPSEHLKTDKNFIVEVDQSAADIVIDFDLSRSLVVTYDGSGTPSYKLKPVLHIVYASEAATISGRIAPESFIGVQNAKMTVLYNPDPAFPTGEYEEYTVLEVASESASEPTEFSIYWLVPDNTYKVEIDFDTDGFDYDEVVDADDLEPGEIWNLNNNNPIKIP